MTYYTSLLFFVLFLLWSQERSKTEEESGRFVSGFEHMKRQQSTRQVKRYVILQKRVVSDFDERGSSRPEERRFWY